MEQLRSGTRVAVFIDAENVVIESEKAGILFQIGPIIERIREEGQIVFTSAYGDWAEPPLYKYRKQFRQIQLHEVSTDRRGKNTADIELAVDALEMVLLNHAPDVLVLLTGDRDLVPLVRKVKRYGKHVVGIGVKGSTSLDLEQECSTFLYVDEILAPGETPVASAAAQTQPAATSVTAAPQATTPAKTSKPVSPATPAAMSHVMPATAVSAETHQARIRAYHLLTRAVSSLERQGRMALGASTRQFMQQLESTFSPMRLGFASFKDFVLAAADDDYVHYRESPTGSGDFHMELSASSPAAGLVARSTVIEPDGPEEVFRYDTPEAARDSYRQILLTRKKVSLLPWADRMDLVYHLWELFGEAGAEGLSMFEMKGGLRQFAYRNGLRIPDQGITKIIQTLNIAKCFAHDGKTEYFQDLSLPLVPAVDEKEALQAMNGTYVTSIRLGEPNARLSREGVALLLFDQNTPEAVERADKAIVSVGLSADSDSPTAMAEAFSLAKQKKVQ